MTSLIQQALGADWDKLPPALQAHYASGQSRDTGALAVSYPAYMQPLYSVLYRLGALVNQRHPHVPTVVRKGDDGRFQTWQRTMHYPGGRTLRFDSRWELVAGGQIIEWVNPLLGLRMLPYVVGNALHYQGICFVLRVGRWQLSIPEWLCLGHTTIEEQAVDQEHFAMDFRLTHPLLGEVFRYAGTFRAEALEPRPAAES